MEPFPELSAAPKRKKFRILDGILTSDFLMTRIPESAKFKSLDGANVEDGRDPGWVSAI